MLKLDNVVFLVEKIFLKNIPRFSRIVKMCTTILQNRIELNTILENCGTVVQPFLEFCILLKTLNHLSIQTTTYPDFNKI